jgi:hypothetical protein
MNRRLTRLGLGLTLAFTALAPSPDHDPKPARDPDVGRSFQIPYRLTNTNHFLVRVRINGKGPFNFLVDTGAPALYVATETAKKVGLKPAEDSFWTVVKQLDFEGGAALRNVNARVEDPFQLVGMNALGLPGASIDGILGFTVLARFRLELDPTKDRMTWTRLDFEPKDPPVPRHGPGEKPPAEMQAMNALGPLAKLAAVLMGKQPEDELVARGFLGLELRPADDGVRVAGVLAGTPAEKAGVRAGDRLVRVGKHAIRDVAAARVAVAEVKPGNRVTLVVQHSPGAEEITLTVTAGEGF